MHNKPDKKTLTFLQMSNAYEDFTRKFTHNHELNCLMFESPVCKCILSLPEQPQGYRVYGPHHLIQAYFRHECPVREELQKNNNERDWSEVWVLAKHFQIDNGALGQLLLGKFAPIAMDGCSLEALDSVCAHNLPSWPLYLGYLDKSWLDLHFLLDSGESSDNLVLNPLFPVLPSSLVKLKLPEVPSSK
jgi:hypothetical protein